jgi:hypothetical protein
MRGLKSTLALLAVLVGLGAYIYFAAWNQPESPASNLEKVFPGLDQAKLETIRVQAQSGEVTDLEKDGTSWQITMPVDARAADPEMQGITSTLGSMEIARVIEENPADLGQFGLETPSIVVEFKGSDPASSGKIVIGDKTPTGSSLYATRNDEKRVFLINSYHETPLNRGPFELRDKSLVSLQRDKIEGAEVIIAGRPQIDLKKAGTDEWTIVRPISAKADSSAAESLVARVETAQMKSIISEQPTPVELRKYGLDKPEVTVNVLMGDQRATLMVGARTEGGNYVRAAGRPTVAIVEETLVDDLKKEVNDYRRKSAFEMRSYNATRVDLVRGAETAAFERVKGEGEAAVDKWRRVSPNPADADTAKVEAFLAALADMNIIEFVDSTAGTGLDAPVATVTAKFDEGQKEEKVTFGKGGSDIYVARPGEPGAGRILADRYNEAMTKLDELLK